MPKQKSRFAQVMAAVRSQRGGLIFLSCLVNLLLLVTAIYMLQVYDRVLSSGSVDTLIWLTVIAFVAILAYGLIEQSRRIILGRTAGFIDSELNAPVLKRAMEKKLAGEVPEAGVRDVSDLRNFYQSDAALAFLDVPWTPIFLAFIWLLHPLLGVVATCGGLAVLAAALLNDAITRKKQQETSAALRSTNEDAIRFVEGGETISPMGMAPALFARWRDRHEQAHLEQQAVGERTTTILSVTRSLRLAVQISVLGLGAFLVLQGLITAGAMIAASIITGRALAPLDRVTAAWNRFVAARSARRKLQSMFVGLEQEPDAIDLPKPEGFLHVADLFFAPPGQTTPLLQNVGFAIDEPGTICAIVGPSGVGKSTLCRLLVGAWKPLRGHVRLDSADIFSWDPSQLGKYIGYLPQTVQLFPGTVAENIARFEKIDSAAVIRAAKLAGVHEMILHLPNGYETDLGPYAERISLGQKQRIGLARALFGDPSFIVLDEPNANLDTAGDSALMEALVHLKKAKKTVIIVSHRAEILKAANKVLLLSDAGVARFGDREVILGTGPKRELATKSGIGTAGRKEPARVTKRQRISIGPNQAQAVTKTGAEGRSDE